MRTVIVLFALLLISACAQRPAAPVPSNIKTIAAASTCGRTMTRETMTWLNVGMHEYSSRAIVEWGLDKNAPRMLSEHSRPGIQLLDWPVKGENFPTFATYYKYWPQNLIDKVRAEISSSNTPADAYLLVLPSVHGDYNSMTHAFDVNPRYAVGMFSRIRHFYAHAVCRAVLIKPDDLSLIAETTVFELKSMPAELRLDKWDDYSPSQLEEVRAGVTEAFGLAMSQLPNKLGFGIGEPSQ